MKVCGRDNWLSCGWLRRR